MRFIQSLIGTVLVMAGATTVGGPVQAEERPYTEGIVSDVTGVRTVDGKFLEYMKFVAGPWKQEMEASKKAGLVLKYGVLSVQPNGPDEPDVLICIIWKNWAAIDGLSQTSDPISKKVYGAADATNDKRVDLDKLRRILGTTRMQTVNLK